MEVSEEPDLQSEATTKRYSEVIKPDGGYGWVSLKLFLILSFSKTKLKYLRLFCLLDFQFLSFLTVPCIVLVKLLNIFVKFTRMQM
jgi:hypothetical protein